MLEQVIGALLLVCLFVSSCHNNPETTLLKKATKVHQESAAIEDNLNEKLQELIQKKNSINIQGRALTTQEMTFVDIIETLESNYLGWKEQFSNSATLHSLSGTTKARDQDPPKSDSVDPKEIYANQIELHYDIVSLREEVEDTYEKWINEV